MIELNIDDHITKCEKYSILKLKCGFPVKFKGYVKELCINNIDFNNINLFDLICDKIEIDGKNKIYEDLNIILPKSLKELHIHSFIGLNQVNSLFKFPRYLDKLILKDNIMTLLPELPDTIKVLTCTHNMLKSLSELPSKLKILNCSHNKLVKLPNLPDTLRKLYCNNNKLTNIPTLPNIFWKLDCSYNNLNKIPVLPNTIKELMIIKSGENITCDKLPDSLEILCTDSLLLSKLPLHENIKILYLDYNKEIELKNIIIPTIDMLFIYDKSTSNVKFANINSSMKEIEYNCISTSDKVHLIYMSDIGIYNLYNNLDIEIYNSYIKNILDCSELSNLINLFKKSMDKNNSLKIKSINKR